MVPATRSGGRLAPTEDPQRIRTSTKKDVTDSVEQCAKPAAAGKRKAPYGHASVSEDRKRRKLSDEAEVATTKSQTVHINRAPVLTLWSACVTQFQRPDLDWSTCISAGGAIASLCAVAKGRSIGVIEKADESHPKKKSKREGNPQIQIMGFKLQVIDGLVELSGKPKPGNDGNLIAKFGDAYDEVKTKFQKCLDSWQGAEEELNKHAFEFYEQFRPTVRGGQSGWGKKGELKLEKIEEVVMK